MDKRIGIAILAHGKTHIDESLDLLKSIKEKTNYEFDYYIATNDVNRFRHLIVNVIKIEGEFNYNLKMIPIEECMKYNDVTIFIDSDSIMMEDIYLNNFINLQEGLHAKIYENYPKIYPFYGALQNESGIEDVPHFFEFFFIIKLTSDNKKKTFFDNWRRLSEKTKPFHINSKGKSGANVGLFIGAACKISDIEIIDYKESTAHDTFLVFHHLFNNDISVDTIVDKIEGQTNNSVFKKLI